MPDRTPSPDSPHDPLSKSRVDFEQLITHISMPDSPVGIDAQFTHAIIIDFLRQIYARLDALERRLDARSE